jgi:hypothetical protein
MEQRTSWEANDIFCAGWGFITVFTRPSYWSLAWARWIQSTSRNPISLRSILIQSSHVRLGLPNVSFSSGLRTMRAMCPTNLLLLNLIALIVFGEEYRACCSFISSVLQPPISSSLLGSSILLSTLSPGHALNSLHGAGSHKTSSVRWFSVLAPRLQNELAHFAGTETSGSLTRIKDAAYEVSFAP